MRSSNVSMMLILSAAVLFMTCMPCSAQTLAPRPGDWNNLSDPLLWARVAGGGSAGQLSGAGGGQGFGPQAVCGEVGYSYKISKFEITAGQYTAFLNAVAGVSDTYSLYNTMMDTANAPEAAGCNIRRDGQAGAYTYSVADDWADRPVNWVSWGDAARYCNWLTNGMPSGENNGLSTENGTYALNGAMTVQELMAVSRKSYAAGGRYAIATEDEWYKAAYHANDGQAASYFTYTTASNAAPSNLFDDPDAGNSANFRAGELAIDAPYFRTDAGEFEMSPSAYGTFDQGGNVREWNESAILTDSRGLRGGSYDDEAEALASNWRGYALPTTEDAFTGFRIVEIPEPATMALLALGGASLLGRRRRAVSSCRPRAGQPG